MLGPGFRALILACLLPALVPRLGEASGIDYLVTMPGLEADLASNLSTVSDCVSLRDAPPETMGLLNARMRNDLKAFTEALQALGYFKAVLDADVNATTTPVTVRFQINPGPRFTFAVPELVLHPDAPSVTNFLRPTMHRLKSGAGYASSQILEVEASLLDELRNHGYPRPALQTRKVVADHATNTVRVRLELATGTSAKFGQTAIEGLDRVAESYIQDRLSWTPDTPFDNRLVERTREHLIRTGLFRSVLVEPQEITGGRVDMRVLVREAPPRTVRAGTWYYSDQGPGGSMGWTHRNLLGGGQELNLGTELSARQQSATGTLAMPGMWHPDQTLGLSAAWKHERTDVYSSRSLALSSVLTRDVSDLRLSYGLAYRLAEVDKDEVRRFNLVSIPLTADMDKTDTVLDPTKGWTLSTRVEPFTALENRDSSFVLWSVDARHYLPLIPEGKLTLATRGHYGVLAGTGRESVPDDLLLYAGGGGSVRGYAYQYAGPLDEDDDPLGGVSVVDMTAELRWRVNQDFGAVIFGDGGRAFTERSPKNFEDFFWAVGTGIRYYTPIGPIRLDVAVPLDRRDGVDAPFQVYVSLGQAF